MRGKRARPAIVGVMREPSAGRSDVLAGRRMIQFVLVVFLFGRMKLPMNVLPFASSITSPGFARLMASCGLSLDPTLWIVAPAGVSGKREATSSMGGAASGGG